MPSDVMHDITLREATPQAGEGALGTCRIFDQLAAGRRTRLKQYAVVEYRAGGITGEARGVCESALKPQHRREDLQEKDMTANQNSGNPTIQDEKKTSRKRDLWRN